MKSKYLVFSLLLIGFSLSSCRFTIEESDYVGHYEGTYRLGNFFPSEGNAVLDITSAGNNKCNIMFWSAGSDSIFYYNWNVKRVSGGIYGANANFYPNGNSSSNGYVVKAIHYASLYLNDASVYLYFTGYRTN